MKVKDIAIWGLVAFGVICVDVATIGALIPYLISRADDMAVAGGVVILVFLLWIHVVAVAILVENANGEKK